MLYRDFFRDDYDDDDEENSMLALVQSQQVPVPDQNI